MSYVSIWKPVTKRIIDAALDSKNEIIGLLLGRLEEDTLIIEDTITGEYVAEATRAILPAQTMAKIADDLVCGRAKGNLIGWYHSHTESGLFFSPTDVQTQKTLQQFSRLMIGMVVDAATGNVGYYRVDPQNSQPVRLPDDKIRVYESIIPARTSTNYERTPVPSTQLGKAAGTPSSSTPASVKLPTSTTLVAAILVALAILVAILAAWLNRGLTTHSLVINHTRIVSTSIVMPVNIST